MPGDPGSKHYASPDVAPQQLPRAFKGSETPARHGAVNAGAPAQDTFMAALDSARPASPQDRLRHALQLIGFSLALAYALFLAGSAFERAWLIDSLGRVIDNDFIAVWAAGRLVLDGHPAAAYDWSLHRAVEIAVAGRDFASYYGWHYPPMFLFA